MPDDFWHVNIGQIGQTVAVVFALLGALWRYQIRIVQTRVLAKVNAENIAAKVDTIDGKVDGLGAELALLRGAFINYLQLEASRARMGDRGAHDKIITMLGGDGRTD